MSKKIKITNIRHINNLEFTLPSQSGVYVLTGSNGSGKTTLMTCLLRIGWYRAFQDFFKTGNNRIDNYSAGTITYTVNQTSVSYRHAGTRWPPRPRTNSNLFSQYDFPEVRFLPATGNRLFIQEQNINPTDFRTVDDNLTTDLNNILETTKFDNLKYVQTSSTRGPGSGSQRWKRAYVLKIGNNYYSEKNFSLGEILILNTLLLIQDITNGSLLLIDELEMALHPRVQVRLLKYLSKKAIEKDLTIILSTHSSSLIKSAKNLIYLENTDGTGNIKVHTNCYPAIILKDIAIEEDIQPDYVFIVEDEMAELLLKETIQRYAQIETNQRVPIYKVIPIGGYPQVLNFVEHTNNYLFNSKIGVYLFPDFDVETVKNDLREKGNNRTNKESLLYNQFEKFSRITKFLPITPELGVWNWINENTQIIQLDLNVQYSDNTFDLTDLIEQTNNNFPHSSNNQRTDAKNKFKYLVSLIEVRTNENSKRISQYLFGSFVKHYYSIEQNNNILRQTFGQVFNQRGNILAN
ncbi:MAG: AAA family ATPase [Prevotellaceae bacterium]|nr:AAA family ATPase [Prevotellaceae bacterium]